MTTTPYNIGEAGRDRLRGRRALITGGTSGLGLALVQALSARGARVAFIARSEGRVLEVARATGALGIVADVARKQDVHRIAVHALGKLGGLDVLINNASSLGPASLRPLADTECEALALALDTNVLGPFRLTKALLGALAASAREGRGGVVVNVSSDAAIEAYAGWGAYGASKAALRQLTRIWQQELERDGLRLLSLDPGDMDTPLHAQALPGADPTTLQRPHEAAMRMIDTIVQGLARDELAAHDAPVAEAMP